MDVPDPHLTQSDLLRAEIKCLAWVVENLPEQMIENPDYKAEEDIQDESYVQGVCKTQSRGYSHIEMKKTDVARHICFFILMLTKLSTMQQEL